MADEINPEHIELVARAICRVEGHDPDKIWPYAGHKQAAPRWQWHKAQAEAALREKHRIDAGG